MRHATSILKDEDGAVVITAAVMVLVMLTIMGLASVNLSNTEVRISGYESVYLQNFYTAEGTAMECIEMLEAVDAPKDAGLAWLETTAGGITADHLVDSSFWTAGNGSVTPQPSAALPDSQFVVAYEGVIAGSLGIGRSKKHAYTIYGRSATPGRGESIITIGYLVASK